LLLYCADRTVFKQQQWLTLYGEILFEFYSNIQFRLLTLVFWWCVLEVVCVRAWKFCLLQFVILMNRYILEFYNLGICQSCSRVGSTRGTDRFVLGQVRNICTNVGSGPDPRGLGPGILTRPNPTNLYANLTHVNFQ